MAKKAKKTKVSVVKLKNKRHTKLAKRGELEHQKLRIKQRSKEKKRAKLEAQALKAQAAREREENETVEETQVVDDEETEDADVHTKRNDKREIEGEEEWFLSSKRRRQWMNDENVVPLLPIKDKNKVIQREQIKQQIEEEEESDSGIDVTAEVAPQKESSQKSTIGDLYIQRERKLAQRKSHIASNCCILLEDPQTNLHKLTELRKLWDDEEPDIQTTSRKLLMISLTEIFKDILPDYSIRIITDQERNQAASLDTKKLRNYEENLLHNYKKYLQILEHCIRSYKDKNDEKTNTNQVQKMFKTLAVKCMCQMLVKRPTFNFSKNIVSILVPLMGAHNREILDIICDAVKQVFKEDKKGLTSLELVRSICRVVKTRKYHVNPKVIDVFLVLKIKEINTVQRDTRKMTYKEKMRHMSRSERKREKRRAELDKQLEDAAVQVNNKKLLQSRTDIISAIFTLYFFILKKEQDSKLLSPVLAGLAKFAHLINVDFFADLFKVFKKLLDSDEMKLDDVMNITITAFTILSGQGEALNIEPSHFYSHVYKTLPSIVSKEHHHLVPKLLQLLRMMFMDRKKQVSRGRVLAYIKRLVNLALQLPPPETIALLAVARNMIHAFPYADVLFDKEPVGSGIYLPDLDEPEHCNAHNSSLEELHELRHHYVSTIAIFAKHFSRGAPLNGQGCLTGNFARKTPQEMMDIVSKECSPDSFIDKTHDQMAKVSIKTKKKLRQELLQPLMEEICSKHMEKVGE